MRRPARAAHACRRLGVAAVAAVLGACREPLPVPPLDAVWAAPAEEGRELYLDACAPCHGEDGRGGGRRAGHLTVPPPDLTDLAERSGGTFPREYTIGVITGEREIPAHGTAEMPAWRQRFGRPASGATAAAAFYARRRVELLADHVASLQRRDGAAPR
jgi:mono/diheme cytochrome c family protein